MPDFTHIEVEIRDKVAHAFLARPEKANAMNHTLWFEIEKLANWADETPGVRVLVLAGRGRHFTAGIDFSMVMSLFSKVASLPEGTKQETMLHEIIALQRAFTALEKCRKPVIAAVHGSCYGGGIDLIAACDFRYAAEGARFCIKEIDLAIVADIGTLQRLPSIIGEGRTRELAMTARVFGAEEAERIGLVNRVFADSQEMLEEVEKVAGTIAEKSPLTVRGIKQVMNHSRDHGVEEGLRHVATWNASMLLSADAQEAMQAMMQKRQPKYYD